MGGRYTAELAAFLLSGGEITGIGNLVVAKQYAIPLCARGIDTRAAPSTRAVFGLGLGLSIAKHLVELHGGVIAAQSPGEGMGATFTVVLPATPAVGQQAAGASTVQGDEVGRRSQG